MELKLNIRYKELLELIKQLPASQLTQLKKDLTEDIIKDKSAQELDGFQQLILNGPTMTEDQYEQFIANRKQFNQWRVN